jgi:kynureninase
VPVLSAAPLLGALAVHRDAGIDRIRQKSLALTGYLMDVLVAMGLTDAPYGYSVGSPRDDARRGGHVAIEHDAAEAIAAALRHRGVIPDFRKPDVIRLAPVALYTSFHDIWRAAAALRDIIDEGAHLQDQVGRLVT